jgi:simple sugar transport system permease protein
MAPKGFIERDFLAEACFAMPQSKRLGPISRSAVAVVCALATTGALVAAVGADPIQGLTALFEGSVGSVDALSVTAVRTTPLLLAGLGVALSFRGGLFNIGAEGQLYLGALGATIVGLWPWSLPGWLHLLLALAAGFVFGALWAAVPGLLRAYRGTSEVVITLMLNYVAIELIGFLVDTKTGPLGERDASFSQSAPIATSATLPILVIGTSLHAGILLAILAAVTLHILMEYTPFGFRVRMVGASPRAARYAGVTISRHLVSIMLLSGGLAGLAGASEILGLRHRLYDRFSPGYGFDAIAVALLAQCHAIGSIATAGFFGALRAGANQLQQATGIETSVILIIQALTVLFVIGSIDPAKRRNA